MVTNRRQRTQQPTKNMWAWRIRYTRGGATGGKRAGGDSIVFGAIKLKAGRGNIK